MNTAEMTTLDASKATDQASYEQINNVEEGLYLLGKNAKVQNALATSTKNSADGKTWTFTIRKDAKWSNGDPVTAKDFVYSWRRTIDPKTASEYAYLFSGIKNADAIVSGKWSNKEYDKYVAASKTTSSTCDRFKDLAKAEQILLEEQGVTPLYHPIEAWMVKPSVKGVIYNGAGANYSFKYAYLK